MSLSPPRASPSPSSPSDASQLHPCSPRETSEAPSDPSHPRDAFTVLRLSARLPLPLSDDDDDDDDGYDDDYKESRGQSDGDRSDRRVHPRTRIQSLELCFHADFLASAALDDRPFSLHFASPPNPILFYSVPPSLEPPTPPYYIHEIPDIIDLTRERGPGPCPPRPLRRNIALALSALVFAALFAALGFLAACHMSAPADLPAYTLAHVPADTPGAIQADALRPTKPTVISSPAGQRYAFSFATDTRPFALHRNILALQDHRLALQPPLIDALDRMWSLSGVETIVQHLCLHVAVHLAPAEGGDAEHTSEGMDDIGLLCEHLLRRFRNVGGTWIEMRTSVDFDTIPSNLAYAARLLNMSSFDDIGDVVRAALFDADRDPFVAACRLCDSATATKRSAHDPAMPASPPVRSWHFACLPNFTRAAADDDDNHTTATFLLDWATARSAQRFETLHNAPLDVDDTPLFPDNQHPFSEADEVISAKLPAEAAVFALTRHLVEVAVCISTLVSLVEKSVIMPVTDATSSDRYNLGQVGEQAGQPLSSKTRRPKQWAWLPSWLGYEQAGRSEMKKTTLAIVNDVNDLLAIRNSNMIPIIRLMGQVAAGLSRGCVLSADVLRDLDNLDRAGPAGWETTEASVRAPVSSPMTDAGAVTMIELKHVTYTIDVRLEAESLSKASELLRGLIKTRPVARTAQKMKPNDPEEATKAPSKTNPIRPRNDREAEFLEGLRNGGVLTHVQGLSGMFQGFREAAQDDVTGDDDTGGVAG